MLKAEMLRTVSFHTAYVTFRIHRPEIYAEFADYFGFPATANIPARQYQKVTPYYRTEDLAATELKDDLGTALDLYNDAWFNSIRIGN